MTCHSARRIYGQASALVGQGQKHNQRESLLPATSECCSSFTCLSVEAQVGRLVSRLSCILCLEAVQRISSRNGAGHSLKRPSIVPPSVQPAGPKRSRISCPAQSLLWGSADKPRHQLQGPARNKAPTCDLPLSLVCHSPDAAGKGRFHCMNNGVSNQESVPVIIRFTFCKRFQFSPFPPKSSQLREG